MVAKITGVRKHDAIFAHDAIFIEFAVGILSVTAFFKHDVIFSKHNKILSLLDFWNEKGR